jgi:hypothetical protein
MNGVIPAKNVASANVGLKAICAFEYLCNMNVVIRAGFVLSKMYECSYSSWFCTI